MNEDRLLEQAPLFALGVLDREEAAAFKAAIATSPRAQAELRAFGELVGRLGLATAPVPPSLALRRRVLDAVKVAPAAPARRWLVPALAASLVAALATLGWLRSDRDRVRQEAQTLQENLRLSQEEAAALRQRVAEEAALRALIEHPDSRVASLAGLPAAPGARARVVWNPARREAVLLASGLAPTPAGKAYEVWVIAAAAPVPAGVFRVDASGLAVFRLPAVEDLGAVKTFAVTLEPEQGTPAPTGPMVLAGAIS